MYPLPIQMFIEPTLYRAKARLPPRKLSVRTTLARLCKRAGIRLRATVPHRDIVVYRGHRQVRTPHFDLVGVPVNPRSPEGALRALEALAHSFHDHAARTCVCGRSLFRPPTVEELNQP